MTKPTETAKQFIARKCIQFERALEREKPIMMKDIGRKGRHAFLREAWTFHVQHNLPEKVLLIERLRKIGTDGEIVHKRSQKAGEIEYRIGYYIVGKIGRAHGRWIWGQFCLLAPAKDFTALLRKAKQEGTLK